MEWKPIVLMVDDEADEATFDCPWCGQEHVIDVDDLAERLGFKMFLDRRELVGLILGVDCFQGTSYDYPTDHAPDSGDGMGRYKPCLIVSTMAVTSEPIEE